MTGSPFQIAMSDRRRLVLIAAGAVLIVVVFAATYLLARKPAVGSAAAGGDHAAMQMTEGPGPVSLTSAQAERIGVTFATAEGASIGRMVRTVGQVTFDETRVKTISPKIDGWIEQLYVNATGQYVARGQALFTIYSPMLVTAQEELLLARRLVADVADGTVEAARGAEDLLAAARRRLLYWDISPDEVARIERTGEVRRALTLRSPVSGFVVEKPVFAGQRIMAGDAIYKVADLSVIWVEGEVFERDLPVVRVGQRMTAQFHGSREADFAGRIAYIYPTVNPETRTVRIRVTLPNPGGQLKPGMYATLTIEGTAAASAVTVPRSALLSTGERNIVFVRRDDGRLEPRLVTPGRIGEDRIEILSGVGAGETVVASATFLVDAESNLSTLMGGMGNMPGMDMTAPSAGPAPNGAHRH
jgi:membrane fusion protein, copper/silver efflux system